MALAIFDLDDTLINGDSASLFLRFLVDKGLADTSMLAKEAELMQAYHLGLLRMEDYMSFTLQALKGRSVDEVRRWVAVFIEQMIAPIVFAEARQVIEKHRAEGNRVLIISATGEHIVGPVARFLGVADYLAIGLEDESGLYTGQTKGVLTYQQGKVLRLHDWLQQEGEVLVGSTGYSDSRNDLPLLRAVEHACVVNPDSVLCNLAAEEGWKILRWCNVL
ncbi:HAD family hydrolase [Iodobacter fluviatilis]|uniref:HAD hydrolase, family IB n=1 Tax=Iodobacter fluviatilis TaxID=537 RepID=A0A377QAE9_9NEIS|nr:HAD family hydrolase [Iodobacter fluviatilis]TCU81745.1 HAD superfamily hydrolase (TIGR01490 family) [Iodobacter fluviatilis]STQ91852.1 HAD hydrolase, family IB [Iodobacter fluviatilis]